MLCFVGKLPGLGFRCADQEKLWNYMEPREAKLICILWAWS